MPQPELSELEAKFTEEEVLGYRQGDPLRSCAKT
jgi:hypothetical protein